jgi:hypothetical protein
MELEIVKVSTSKLASIISDPTVYVIKHSVTFNEMLMRPIRQVMVEDVLSGENLIVRITMKE